MSAIEDRKKARIESRKKENDHKQWESAFNRQEELGYDSNFMALIAGISSACAIAGVDIPEKCKAVKDALDEIWIERFRRAQENDLNLDYSEFGSMPHSYSEVRAESEK